MSVNVLEGHCPLKNTPFTCKRILVVSRFDVHDFVDRPFFLPHYYKRLSALRPRTTITEAWL